MRLISGGLAATSAIVVVSVACGSSEGSPDTVRPGTTFRTSGDTTIATTDGVGDRARWRATLVEEVSIGALEGPAEELFGGVSVVAARPDGGAFVYDWQADEIRWFDADGSFVRRVGREGEGPGEHQEVNNMYVLPDGRLVLNDPRLRRISWYDSAGALERSATGRSGLLGSDGTGFAVRQTDEAVWVRTRVYVGGDATDRKDAVIRHARDGTADTIFSPDFGVDRYRMMVQHPEVGVRLEVATPFAPKGLWAIGHRGEEYRARTDRYDIEVENPDGSVLRIEADATAVPISAAERAYHVERVTESARGVDPSWNWTLPDVPAAKPYLQRLYLGDRGRLWLEVSTPGEPYERETEDGGMETRWRAPTLFDVFESDGTYLGAVEPPAGTTFAAFRGDTVWAVYRDDLGVSYVKRFRVAFPDPSQLGRPLG